tara:strand:+ start:2278 stop:2664 length:387 start_codon:yes stop_codon:yes gene_type:complete
MDRICEQCGEVFDFKGGSLLCSDKCRKDAKRESARLYGLGRKWQTRIESAKRMTEHERRERNWSEETWDRHFISHFTSELIKRDRGNIYDILYHGPSSGSMPEDIYVDCVNSLIEQGIIDSEGNEVIE